MDVGTLLRRLPMRKRRRSRPQPQPDRSLTLTPILLDCPECQHRTYADYKNYRTISTLDSVFRLTLTIRRCPNPECSRLLRPYRPEAESHFALPYHSSDSTSWPWSAGSAMPSTAVSPRSTANSPAGG